VPVTREIGDFYRPDEGRGLRGPRAEGRGPRAEGNEGADSTPCEAPLEVTVNDPPPASAECYASLAGAARLS
jgi:hypothetical protein